MTTMNTKTSSVAVAFLASDVNRFSINALTGAIEQDPDLQVTLSFPHPRSATTCQAEKERDFQDIRGLAFLAEDSTGKKRVMRTGRAPLIELNEHYPSIGLQHHRLGAIEIGRGCQHACGFCQ